MTSRIIIPYAPPAALSVNNRRRGNVWAQRAATEQVLWHALPAVREQWPGDMLTGPLSLTVTVLWPCGRKGKLPDTDTLGSFTKPYVDALEHVAIDNDSQIERVTFTQQRLDRSTTETRYPDGAVVLDLEVLP